LRGSGDGIHVAERRGAPGEGIFFRSWICRRDEGRFPLYLGQQGPQGPDHRLYRVEPVLSHV
jgi:hypothetical protein